MSTDCSLQVKLFTEESSGKPVPTHPRLMSYEEFFFISKMVISELMELGATVAKEGENLRETMKVAAENAEYPTFSPVGKSETELKAEQVDALVDIQYYCENAAVKAGFYTRPIFEKVHEVNLNKRFEDGTFHRYPDGKVMKPPGHKPANLIPVIEGWEKNGTWSSC